MSKVTLDDLAIITAKGFSELESKMDKRFEQIDKRFDRLEAKFDSLDHKVYDDHEPRIRRLEKKVAA